MEKNKKTKQKMLQERLTGEVDDYIITQPKEVKTESLDNTGLSL
jgi:hypothetical protein